MFCFELKLRLISFQNYILLLFVKVETGFSAAVDALTFNGIDPTNKDGAPEVGTSGVPLYCIDSLFALTEDIPIEKISVTLVVEPFTSAPVCSMYFNMAEIRGYDVKQLMGTTQNDILTILPFLLQERAQFLPSLFLTHF